MFNNVSLIVGLLIAAMVFLVLEILTPMFGLFVAAALAALAVAIWMSFAISSVLGTVMLISLAILVPMYLVLLVRRLPKSRFTGKMFLPPATDGTGAGQPDAPELEQLVGRTGKTLTPLRPTGAVRIDGKRIVALAESGRIEHDVTVRVIRFDGMDAIVRAVDDDQPGNVL